MHWRNSKKTARLAGLVGSNCRPVSSGVMIASIARLADTAMRVVTKRKAIASSVLLGNSKRMLGPAGMLRAVTAPLAHLHRFLAKKHARLVNKGATRQMLVRPHVMRANDVALAYSEMAVRMLQAANACTAHLAGSRRGAGYCGMPSVKCARSESTLRQTVSRNQAQKALTMHGITHPKRTVVLRNAMLASLASTQMNSALQIARAVRRAVLVRSARIALVLPKGHALHVHKERSKTASICTTHSAVHVRLAGSAT
jgi:hypothetical protein